MLSRDLRNNLNNPDLMNFHLLLRLDNSETSIPTQAEGRGSLSTPSARWLLLKSFNRVLWRSLQHANSWFPTVFYVPSQNERLDLHITAVAHFIQRFMFYRLLLLFQLLHLANIAWCDFKLLIGTLYLNLGDHGILEIHAIIVTFHIFEMAQIGAFFLEPREVHRWEHNFVYLIAPGTTSHLLYPQFCQPSCFTLSFWRILPAQALNIQEQECLGKASQPLCSCS
jgi:hypothetical protein